MPSPDVPLAVGDVVRVSAPGQLEGLRATVTLASGNGRSLVLSFGDRLFRLGDQDGVEDAYMGSLLVLWTDGVWREILTNREVTVQRG